MHVRPMGPLAFLVECEGAPPADVAARIRSLAGVKPTDVVPAARSVLVECADADAALVLADGVRAMDRIAAIDVGSAEVPTVAIDVCFDGEDLDEVADRIGRTVEQVVDLVVTGSYRVDFCGFAPGFAYLSGLDPSLHLPRRGRPRTRVPAGSLAIAAGYAAVYPAESPGGWHLLGRTDAVIWTLDREPPALLVPGTTVAFTAVDHA